MLLVHRPFATDLKTSVHGLFIVKIIMSSLSHPALGLLEDLKNSLLQLWLKAQVRGILSIGAILGIVVLYAVHYLASPFRKLPLGPRGYPIIANLLELKAGQWVKFAEWQKTYG